MKNFIPQLTKLATELDSADLEEYANQIDDIVEKIASIEAIKPTVEKDD